MISLRYFVLILMTLCCREIASPVPLLNFETSLLAIVGLTLGFAILTKTVAYRLATSTLCFSNPGRHDIRDTFLKQRQTIERVWCVVLPLLLLSAGWFSWTQQMHQSGWPQALVILSCFLPTLVFLVLVEMTSAQLDQLSCTEISHLQPANQASVGSTCRDSQLATIHPASWTQQWLLRIRLGDMAGLVTCLFPVVVLSSISDSMSWAELHLGIRWWWMKIPLVAVILIGFIAVFPMLLTRWTGGQPMPSGLKLRVLELASKSGIYGVQPKFIPSQRRWAGAAIVGWFPKMRHLWLGDALVRELSPRQLDMVVLHELAHVRRMHYLWRMLPMLLAVTVASVIWAIGAYFDLTQILAFKFSVGFAAGSAMLLGLGKVARYCELDADKIACDLAIQATEWSSLHSPAKELGSALSLLLEEPPSQSATWLHPSLGQRLSALAGWSAQ